MEQLKEFLQEIKDKNKTTQATKNNNKYSLTDVYGGDCNDAYDDGKSDGKYQLAKEILERFFNIGEK